MEVENLVDTATDLLGRITLHTDTDPIVTNELSRSVDIVVQGLFKTPTNTTEAELIRYDAAQKNAESFTEEIYKLLNIVEHRFHNIVSVHNKFSYDTINTKSLYSVRVLFSSDFNGAQPVHEPELIQAINLLQSIFTVSSSMRGQRSFMLYVDTTGINHLPTTTRNDYMYVSPDDYNIQSQRHRVARKVLNRISEWLHTEYYESQYEWAKSANKENVTLATRRLHPGILFYPYRRITPNEDTWPQYVNRYQYQRAIQPLPTIKSDATEIQLTLDYMNSFN